MIILSLKEGAHYLPIPNKQAKFVRKVNHSLALLMLH